MERAAPLAGTLLEIRDAPHRAQGTLLLLSRDRTIALAHDPSGGADPTLDGVRVRVGSDAGETFDASYDLPAGSWRAIGTSGSRRGYRSDDRPCALDVHLTLIAREAGPPRGDVRSGCARMAIPDRVVDVEGAVRAVEERARA